MADFEMYDPELPLEFKEPHIDTTRRLAFAKKESSEKSTRFRRRQSRQSRSVSPLKKMERCDRSKSECQNQVAELTAENLKLKNKIQKLIEQNRNLKEECRGEVSDDTDEEILGPVRSSIPVAQLGYFFNHGTVFPNYINNYDAEFNETGEIGNAGGGFGGNNPGAGGIGRGNRGGGGGPGPGIIPVVNGELYYFECLYCLHLVKGISALRLHLRNVHCGCLCNRPNNWFCRNGKTDCSKCGMKFQCRHCYMSHLNRFTECT